MDLIKKPAAAPVPAPAPAETPEGAPAPEAVLATALEKLNNDLRAEMGRKLKAIEDKLAGATPAEKKAEATPNTVEATLRERLQRFEGREEKQKNKAVRMALREALQASGADPALAELAVPAVLEAERSRLTVDENDFGDYAIKYGDGSTSLQEWAKAYLSTETGKKILAKRASPSVRLPNGETAPKPAKRQVPSSMARYLTNEELKSGNIELVDG